MIHVIDADEPAVVITVADLYPAKYRDALVAAGEAHDIGKIDVVIDEMAQLGLCWARSCDRGPKKLAIGAAC